MFFCWKYASKVKFGNMSEHSFHINCFYKQYCYKITYNSSKSDKGRIIYQVQHNANFYEAIYNVFVSALLILYLKYWNYNAVTIITLY